MSTGHDYTNDPMQNSGASTNTQGASDAFNPDDYSFLPMSAAPDVEEIEREAEARDFRQIDPGDHLLVVKGFMKAPEVKLYTGYVAGRQVSWQSPSVGVRLARADDPQATILDFFDLPPTNPAEQDAYLNASKKQDGTNPGFGARKFGQFISRLGFPFAPGAPLPAEACRLGNWVGREVHATVAMQKQDTARVDQRTGLPFPPRTQVKLFSYRPSESTVQAGSGQAADQIRPVLQGQQPSRPGPRPPSARQPAGSPLAAAGLNDL